MLRIVTSPSVAAAKSYYTGGLSRGDYYTDDAESRGMWGGRGAKLLGLAGDVKQHEFNFLCDNRHPVGGHQLTPRFKANRRVGYDINFHAPKSLSVLFAMTGDRRLLDAFQASVRETMQQLEQDVHTRVRANDAMADRRTSNLTWAEFTHYTARPVDGHPDPHLHSHCFVFNATHDDVEGRWKAIQLGPVKTDAYFYEAAFHNRLCGRLRELGYSVVAKGKFWELEGFTADLLGRFSRRGKEVETLAKKLGIENDAKQKDGLAAKTREAKRTDLSGRELKALWESSLSDDERSWLRKLPSKVTPPPSRDTVPDAARVLGFATEHTFERRSTVNERRLLDTALRASLGSAPFEQIAAALHTAPLLTATKNDTRIYSRQDVLDEERFMIQFAKDGRGTCAELNKKAADKLLLSGSELTLKQRRTARHVLRSPDRVILVRGAAGTGKTHLMQSTVKAIEAGGRDVVVLAPTAEASRDVLRNEGFKNADTVAKFLASPILQNQARGQVVWIDEAGLIGTKTMANLFHLADELGARVILGGDQRQHRSVERGDAFRLLIQRAGLKTSELSDIMRQRGEYREVAMHLSAGRVAEAWTGIEKMKAVEEMKPEQTYERAASDYVAAKRAGKSCLVVSPTHVERRAVTEFIREQLFGVNVIKGKQRDVYRLHPTNWTEAERKDGSRYEPGHVVQFHRAVGPFKPGERAEVLGVTEKGIRVADESRKRYDMLVPFDRARHFMVYEESTLELAAGDRIRVTVNAMTGDGKHTLHNGSVHDVRSIARDGSIRLRGGVTLPKNFGHIDHGYVLTSHKAQGKTVDEVVVVQTAISRGATTPEQLYVSVTRGRERLKIYTDDKAALKELALRGTDREAAMEVFHDDHEHQHEMMRMPEHQRERKRERERGGHER